MAVLTIEVKTAFHLKNQAFLDMTEAYDNVLIDILCQELKKEGVSIPLVFFL
jgi:purine nucleoside phosphorylase